MADLATQACFSPTCTNTLFSKIYSQAIGVKRGIGRSPVLFLKSQEELAAVYLGTRKSFDGAFVFVGFLNGDWTGFGSIGERLFGLAITYERFI